MKQLANAITAIRIGMAACMFLSGSLSRAFFLFYCVGGISDLLDGTVARKLGTANAFGARLDSVADLLFVSSAAVQLMPVLWSRIPVSARWLAGSVVAIKALSFCIGWVRFRKPCFLHTYLNKGTGAAVFLLPFCCGLACFGLLVTLVCALALLAATEEVLCLMKMKVYDAERKGYWGSGFSSGV